MDDYLTGLFDWIRRTRCDWIMLGLHLSYATAEGLLDHILTSREQPKADIPRY